VNSRLYNPRMRLKLPVVVAVFLAATPILAHHGSTGFDQKKPVHLIGKVSELEWMNPHIVIHLEAVGADSKLVTWLVNSFPPHAATSMGFAKSSFAIGTEISVDGYQAIDGSNHVNSTRILFKDGKAIVSPDCFVDEQRCFRPVVGKGK
jgi:uncharacterized protein DUF6152